MTSKRRALVVSPAPNLPPDAGNRARVAATVNALQMAGWEVDFLYIHSPGEDLSDMQKFWGERLSCISFQPPPFPVDQKSRWLLRLEKKINDNNLPIWLKLARKIENSFRHFRFHFDQSAAYNFNIDDWAPQNLGSAALALHQKRGYSLVWVNYVFLSSVFNYFDSGVKKILDTHDRFANRYQTYLKAQMAPRWFSTSVAEELKVLQRADEIIAIQPEEQGVFSAALKRDVRLIEHWPLPDFCDPRLRKPNTILYVASANPLNVNDFLYFYNEIYPKVSAKIPNAKIVVAGGIGAFLPDNSKIIKLGRVDDLKSIYEKATVVINPARSGTGLKIKSVEALSYGKALVCSPHAANFLETEGVGFPYLVGDSPDTFAEHIIKLCADEIALKELENKAKQSAIKRFEESNRALECLLKSV